MFPETHQLNANEVYGTDGMHVELLSYSSGYLLLHYRTHSSLKIGLLPPLTVRLDWGFFGMVLVSGLLGSCS